jgi:hypothetical protein
MAAAMAEGPFIWYVFDRFEDLRRLIEVWGWDVVERGDLSEWDEGRRRDPVMGVVRIRGRWSRPRGGSASFTVKEWWARPPVDGPEEHQGFVLAGYHYTAQSPRRKVRHCYDPVRHPEAPSHVHPHGDEEIQPVPPVTAEAAFAAFQQRLAEELLEDEDIALDEAVEDTVDAIFGEDDDS